jgi:hypothetical protein
MSQTRQPEYAFTERLPLEPVPAGTSLLVTGPSLGGTRELVMGLLGCRPGEGLVLITTDVNGPDAIDVFERGGCAYDTSRMAVVDCTADSNEDRGRNIHSVSAPGDLTGIGIAFSSLYEQLYDGGVERVRTGLYTLAPLLMFVDEVQPLYRFLHTVTGRIRSAGGLGVAAMDPQTEDETTVRTLLQPFDGEIQLREADGHEMRIRGLDDQPDGWHPVDL